MSVNPVTAEIRMHNGRPTVFINGEPRAIAGFNPTNERRAFAPSMPWFAPHKMDVYIPQAWIYHFWQGDDIFDTPHYEADESQVPVDEQVRVMLEQDPDAFVPTAPDNVAPLGFRDLWVIPANNRPV
mgnify:CR=1 FL=1